MMWSVLKYLLVKNPNELFKAIGYDKNKLQSDVFQYIGKLPIRDQTNRPQPKKIIENDSLNFEKVFDDLYKKQDNSSKQPEDRPEEKQPMTITESVSKNINWNIGPEKLMKDSLLIGDLENAVEVAMKCGRDAEAF